MSGLRSCSLPRRSRLSTEQKSGMVSQQGRRGELRGEGSRGVGFEATGGRFRKTLVYNYS